MVREIWGSFSGIFVPCVFKVNKRVCEAVLKGNTGDRTEILCPARQAGLKRRKYKGWEAEMTPERAGE